MANTYDVIVVGLGAVGGAAAYQLGRRGASVLGIDTHTPPHTFGSSHGESRITRGAVGEGEQYVPLVRRTNAIWRELEGETGETLMVTSGGYIICPAEGGAQFHGQTDFVTRSAALAEAYDVPYTLRSAAEVREHVPALNVEDTDHAYYEPSAGVLLPEACLRVQLEAARRHGATLHTGERVQRVEPDGAAVRVITERATYTAAHVILAAGAHNSRFLPVGQAAHLKVYRQVMYWFAADNLPEFAYERFPWVLWIGETLDDFFAVFPCVPGGTPGVKLMTETYVAPSDPDAVKREISEDEAQAMMELYVRRRLNGVGPRLIRAAACAYTVTPDEHFVIDHHPSSERVTVASACSGHGFKHAAAVGEALAQGALGERPAIDLEGFAFSRL